VCLPAAGRLQTMALLPLYQEMITTGARWDHVDEVPHRVGALLVAFPGDLGATLRAWALRPRPLAAPQRDQLPGRPQGGH
jgi:hypothetical protein